MAILYRAAKFKSANMFAMAIWDPTAKFNSCQYFRLYGNVQCHYYSVLVCGGVLHVYHDVEQVLSSGKAYWFYSLPYSFLYGLVS